MSKYFNEFTLKVGNQKFLIENHIYINKISEYNLYAVRQYSDEPLFLISSYFVALLFSKEICFSSDGYIRINRLIDLLKSRKVVFKNCYYDIAYKKKNEIKEEYMTDIIENQNLLRYRD